MEPGAAVVADALDFLDPLPIRFRINGYEEEAKPLGLYEWLRFERSEQRALKLLFTFEFAQGLFELVRVMEAAGDIQFDDVPLDEALAAFVLLSEGNSCAYIDPYFVQSTHQGVGSNRDFIDELASRSVFDMVMVLSQHFPLKEISRMSPEMSFLAYQYILDAQAEERTVKFYLSELGYEKQRIGKGKSMKIKLKPLETPYLTPWFRLRRKAVKQHIIAEAQKLPPLMSRLIKHPERVVGLNKGRRRK
jgi:hypothetical protein